MNEIIWDWSLFSAFAVFIVVVYLVIKTLLQLRNVHDVFGQDMFWTSYTLTSLTSGALFFHPRMRWGQPQNPHLPSSPLLPLAYSAAPAINPPLANTLHLTPLTLTCTSRLPIQLPKTTCNPNTLLMAQRKGLHWLSSPLWVSSRLALSHVFSPPTGWNPLQHQQFRLPLLLLHPQVQKNPKLLPRLHPPTNTLSWWRCTGPTQSLTSMRSDHFPRAEVRRCNVSHSYLSATLWVLICRSYKHIYCFWDEILWIHDHSVVYNKEPLTCKCVTCNI